MSKTVATVLSLKDQFSSTIKGITSNTRDFQNQIKHTQNSVKDMKTAITGAFTNIAVKAGAVILGASLVDFAKQSVKLASDLVEVKNVVDTTFQSNAQSVEAWSKTAMASFGITNLQAQKMNGTFGAMMKSSGVSSTGIVKMSEGLTGLAGDMASFYNLNPVDAFDKLQSAIAGQSKPMRELGVDMSVANLSVYALSLGIQKSFKTMSESEKTTLRYNYLMAKTKDAQGDFTKTNKTWANQLRIAQATIASIGAGIATDLLPYLNKVLNWFNDMLVKAPATIDKIKTKIIELWKEFKVDSILNNLKTTAIDVFKKITTLIDGVSKPFMNFVDSVARLAKTIANDLFPSIQDVNKNVKKDTWNDVKDAINDVLKSATAVCDYINKNWTTLKPIIEGITVSIIAYKVALIAVWTWTLAVKVATEGWEILSLIIGGIALQTNIWTAAQWLLNVAMDANPIGVVTLAIVALGAAIYEVVTHFKEICEWAGKAWDAVTRFTGLDGGKKMVRIDTTNYNNTIDITKPVPKFKKPEQFLIDGSHANGLKNVPYDGYIAQTHKGEAIIPASQNPYNKNNKSTNGMNINIIIQGNMIGNEEYANSMGEHISNRILSALQNS